MTTPSPAVPVVTIESALREAVTNRDAAEWSDDLRLADFWQAEVDYLNAQRIAGAKYAVPF